MAWNFWDKIVGKGKTEPPVSSPMGETAADPELAEKAKKLLPELLKKAKDPATRQKIEQLLRRMQADGVDLNDEKKVAAWVETHKAEMEGNGASKEAAPAAPYVRPGPKIGRNDPCHCGSGKKFKKCHGAR